MTPRHDRQTARETEQRTSEVWDTDDEDSAPAWYELGVRDDHPDTTLTKRGVEQLSEGDRVIVDGETARVEDTNTHFMRLDRGRGVETVATIDHTVRPADGTDVADDLVAETWGHSAGSVELSPEATAATRTAINAAEQRGDVAPDRRKTLLERADLGYSSDAAEVPGDAVSEVFGYVDAYESDLSETEGEATLHDPEGDDEYLEWTRSAVSQLGSAFGMRTGRRRVNFDRQEPNGRFAPEDVREDPRPGVDRAADGRFVSERRRRANLRRRTADGRFAGEDPGGEWL